MHLEPRVLSKSSAKDLDLKANVGTTWSRGGCSELAVNSQAGFEPCLVIRTQASILKGFLALG
jgi:hypothetical protein